MDTLELLQRCQNGDQDAIETLVRAHQRGVFQLALSILDTIDRAPGDSMAEAEEAAQDVFVAAIKSLHRYRGDAALTTWLYAITVNVCRNRLRKRKALGRLRSVLQSLFHTSEAGDATGAIERPVAQTPEELVLRHEAGGALRRAVNALGEKHRVVVILRYYHDFPVAEIARMLRISEGTVHSRLFAARERLKGMLEEDLPPIPPPHFEKGEKKEPEIAFFEG